MRINATLVLGFCLGCAAQHGRGGDGEPGDAPDARDASAPAERDVGAVIAAFIASLRHFTESACICLVESGNYDSQDDCLAAKSNVFNWHDCALRGLSPLDSAKLRSQLDCQVEEFNLRSECVKESACAADPEGGLVGCQHDNLGCPSLDPDILLALSRECSPAMTGADAH